MSTQLPADEVLPIAQRELARISLKVCDVSGREHTVQRVAYCVGLRQSGNVTRSASSSQRVIMHSMRPGGKATGVYVCVCLCVCVSLQAGAQIMDMDWSPAQRKLLAKAMPAPRRFGTLLKVCIT